MGDFLRKRAKREERKFEILNFDGWIGLLGFQLVHLDLGRFHFKKNYNK